LSRSNDSRARNTRSRMVSAQAVPSICAAEKCD
jgi:hypothetical protein